MVVEFALTIPVLFLLVFGALEFTRVNTIRNTVANAAYEGARYGMLPGASSIAVRQKTQEILDTLGIQDASITVTPSVIEDDTEEITVVVDVPMDTNTYTMPNFTKGKTITRRVTLKRETLNPLPQNVASSPGQPFPGNVNPRRPHPGRAHPGRGHGRGRGRGHGWGHGRGRGRGHGRGRGRRP